MYCSKVNLGDEATEVLLEERGARIFILQQPEKRGTVWIGVETRARASSIKFLWKSKIIKEASMIIPKRTPAKNSARDLIPAVFAKSNVPKIPKAFVWGYLKGI